NQFSRIDAPLNLCGYLCKRQIRAEECDPLVGSPSSRIAKIPSGVGCERDGDLGQTYAREFNPIGINLRHENGKCFADLWWLQVKKSVAPFGSEIESICAVRLMRLVGAGDRRDLEAGEWDECSVRDFRITTLGWSSSVAHPSIHVG